MRFRAQVVVRLKPGLLDPQGKAVEGSLPAMGWRNVAHVRVGKQIEFDLEAPDERSAAAQVNDMAARLLSNPVIEVYEVELRAATGIPTDGA